MKKVNSISLIFVDASESSATVVAKIDPEDVTFEDLFDSEDEVQPCVFLAWECVRHLNENEEREFYPTISQGSSAIN